MLSKQGICVQVIEAEEKLDDRPRATHYSSPAVRELRRAGVLDDILAVGFVPGAVTWIKLDGTALAGLDSSEVLADYPDRMVCLPLNHLG